MGQWQLCSKEKMKFEDPPAMHSSEKLVKCMINEQEERSKIKEVTY